MTRNELEQYISIKIEIERLTERITDLEEKYPDEFISYETVKGSSKYFPFCAKNFVVTGVDHNQEDRHKYKLQRLYNGLNEQKEILDETEARIREYIRTIPDSQIRNVFEMTFIAGKTQKQIGHKLHLDQSAVSKCITRYLEKDKVS